jgi:nucleoside-specific outer membrane channel protein Tsx
MRPYLRLVAALAMAAAAPAARAGGFSTTNVQLLQGWGFGNRDMPLGMDNYDYGRLTTLTFNSFSTWEWGDSFFFADLTRGKVAHEDSTSVYAEWHPRLFVNQLIGQKKTGIPFVRNWGLAGEVNQGAGFYAYLGGLGVDFDVPAGWVLGLNVYYRYDKFSYDQWQVSPFWTVPFSIGPVPFLFTGFVDVNGTRQNGNEGVEVWAQPELLVDVLAPFGGKPSRLWVGCEWYLHSFSGVGSANPFPSASDSLTSSPQVMVQWTIF